MAVHPLELKVLLEKESRFVTDNEPALLIAFKHRVD